MSKFKCATCGQEHDSVPTFVADRPTPYWDVPPDKIASDVFLTSDSCVIADRFFFIRGCLEIPIVDTHENFTWGVWVSLSEPNFFLWQDHYDVAQRSHVGPFFGWHCTKLPVYPETMHLQTTVHIRDDGIRPRIELQECDHPLYLEQRDGITWARALEIVHLIQDGSESETWNR